MRVISIIVCLRVGGDPALHKGNTPHIPLTLSLSRSSLQDGEKNRSCQLLICFWSSPISTIHRDKEILFVFVIVTVPMLITWFCLPRAPSFFTLLHPHTISLLRSVTNRLLSLPSSYPASHRWSWHSVWEKEAKPYLCGFMCVLEKKRKAPNPFIERGTCEWLGGANLIFNPLPNPPPYWMAHKVPIPHHLLFWSHLRMGTLILRFG